MIDPFNVLLNKISHELGKESLQSLIHICEIPGAYAENIQDGLALFRYLKNTNRISREKIGYLRNLTRKMLPKRCDLVDLVDEYIKKEYHTDNVSLVLEDFSQSLPEAAVSPNPAVSPVLPPPEDNTVRDQLFNINNEYMHCSCRKFPSCLWASIIILFFAIICTSLFWYADVPRISVKINSNQDVKDGGIYIIIAESLLFVLLIVRMLWKKRVCHQRGYVHLTNLVLNNGMEANGKANVSAPVTYRGNYGSSPGQENIGSHVSVGYIVSSAEIV